MSSDPLASSGPAHCRRVALITGASRGIGEATARELAQRGYALVLAARSAGPLETLAGELSRSGCPALPVPTDVQKPDEVHRLARLAIEHFGRVDVLVNNAGIGSRGLFVARLPERDLTDMITTNLVAPILLTRALLPGMIARRAGTIVFLGSVAGQIGLPGSAIYSTSKFGLRGFALALRREVQHRGVNVVLIAPGFIDTAMTQNLRGLPMPGPGLVARTIADAIERPRREIVIPFFYRLFIQFDRCVPDLVDTVIRLRVR